MRHGCQPLEPVRQQRPETRSRFQPHVPGLEARPGFPGDLAEIVEDGDMGAGDEVGLAQAAAGQPVALVQQGLHHAQMTLQCLAALAQGAGFGGAEAKQGFLHPLVQQDGIDLVHEAAVEPSGQAPGLGAVGQVGGQQERGLLRVLQPAEDGRGLAQDQGRCGPLGDAQDGGHAGRIELAQHTVRFPWTDQGLGPLQPRFAQRQPRRARSGVEGKVEQFEGRHDA